MKTSLVQIRISEQEKANWKAAAEAAGMSLSEYIRFVMNLRIEMIKQTKT